MPALVKKSKLEQLLETPDLVDTICVHIANGGSLIDLAKQWSVPYGHITNWLRNDKRRNSLYQQAMNDRQEWYREAILRELRCMAMSDVRNILDDDGNLKPASTWDDATAACVASFDNEEIFQGKGSDKEYIGQLKKVKLWSKDKSLELIGKYLQMFTQRIEVDGVLTLAEMVNASVDVTETKP